MSLLSDVSLDVLAEDVIDSVFAGYNSQKMSIANGASGDKSFSRGLVQSNSVYTAGTFSHERLAPGASKFIVGDKLVFLDIDPSVSWGFHTQPGALRRIIMNLFGNALKYTSKGYVLVSLKQETAMKGSSGKRPEVVLTVYDSGQGIGEEFLRSKLFTAFSQEDRLAPGTGLGLSLVRHITSSLGGVISVTSKVNRGTVVRVSLPLTPLIEPRGNLRTSSTPDPRSLQGARVCLAGFKIMFDGTGFDDRPGYNSRDVVESICRDWFKMILVSETGEKVTPPDFHICTDIAFDDSRREATHTSTSAPVVVICRNIVQARNYAKTVDASAEPVIAEFISQP
jgi:hypothetical protein